MRLTAAPERGFNERTCTSLCCGVSRGELWIDGHSAECAPGSGRQWFSVPNGPVLIGSHSAHNSITEEYRLENHACDAHRIGSLGGRVEPLLLNGTYVSITEIQAQSLALQGGDTRDKEATTAIYR